MSNDNRELSGYFNFKDKDIYQFMYASQNYGTFYAIYGLLSEDNKSITFKLMNYKGPINIGFISNTVLVDNSDIEIKNDKIILKIALEVKGLSKIRETTLTFNSKINFNALDEIFIERFMHKLEDATSEIFDSEYYYRSGEKNVHPLYHKKDEVTSLVRNFINNKLEKNKKANGGDCNTSSIKIIGT